MPVWWALGGHWAAVTRVPAQCPGQGGDREGETGRLIFPLKPSPPAIFPGPCPCHSCRPSRLVHSTQHAGRSSDGRQRGSHSPTDYRLPTEERLLETARKARDKVFSWQPQSNATVFIF